MILYWSFLLLITETTKELIIKSFAKSYFCRAQLGLFGGKFWITFNWFQCPAVICNSGNRNCLLLQGWRLNINCLSSCTAVFVGWGVGALDSHFSPQWHSSWYITNHSITKLLTRILFSRYSVDLINNCVFPVFGHQNSLDYLEHCPKVVIISYRMLSRLKKSMIDKNWAVMIIDESHNIRCTKKKTEKDEVHAGVIFLAFGLFICHVGPNLYYTSYSSSICWYFTYVDCLFLISLLIGASFSLVDKNNSWTGSNDQAYCFAFRHTFLVKVVSNIKFFFFFFFYFSLIHSPPPPPPFSQFFSPY